MSLAGIGKSAFSRTVPAMMINSLITRCHLFQAVSNPLGAGGHLQDVFQCDMAYIDRLHSAFMGTNFSLSYFIDLIGNYFTTKI